MSKLAKSDVSGIGRDPHRLTTEICVKISVVGVARVLSTQFFSKFHLSIRVVLNLESLEFFVVPPPSPFCLRNCFVDTSQCG